MRSAGIEASAAEAVAARMLQDVGSRLAHSRRVAEQATAVSSLVGDPWSSSLVDAAWLHDIGYAVQATSTGFHPLDGARWLRERGWPTEECRLVAWHTRAGTEARLRGFEQELTVEFAPPPPDAQAALTWADLTSSPAGEPCTAAQRVEEILGRYVASSLVHRATTANVADLMADARSVERQMLVARGCC